MKKFLFIFIISIFFSLTSLFVQAAENPQTTYQQKILPQKKYTLLLDSISFLLEGAGLKASVGVSDNLNIGVLAQRYQLDSEDDNLNSVYSYTHEITNFGIISDYFFSTNASESGFYTSLALISAKLKTQVNGSLFGANTAKNSVIGLQAKAGFQIVSTFISTDLTTQIGLGYGSAGQVSWRLGGSEAELKPALLLDLSLGLKF